MSKFIVAPQANRDLLEILKHIATDNPVDHSGLTTGFSKASTTYDRDLALLWP